MKQFKFFILVCFLCVFSSFAQSKYEVTPLFSFYSGDSLRSFFGGSLQTTYKLTPQYWLGLEGFLGKPRIESGSLLNPGAILSYAFGTFSWNMLGTLGTEKDGNPIDLYTSFSLGPLFLKDQTQVAGSLGGGMAVHFESLPWFLVKFDLKNIFYVLERPTGKSFQSDMVLSLGTSFLF